MPPRGVHVGVALRSQVPIELPLLGVHVDYTWHAAGTEATG